jgi:hypothetical protein
VSLCALAAVALVAGYAWFLGDWIIDDAGISFAYARSLAQGHGLVQQPGVAPVEAYSNLSWVLLAAAATRLGWFDPVVTPKVVGLALVGLAVAVTLSAFGRVGPRLLAAGAGLLLAAATPAVAVWSVSGLENPLYVLLFASLFRTALATLRAPAAGSASIASAVCCGVVAGLAALTRPEGALAVLTLPLAILLGGRLFGGQRRAWREVTVAVGVGAMIVLGSIAFRVAYFGDFVPNTYWAKVQGHTRPLLALAQLGALAAVVACGAKLLRRPTPVRYALVSALVASVLVALRVRSLTRSLGDVSGEVLLGATLLALAARLARGPLPALPAALCATTATTMLAFWSLPGDWMGEYRFASPFVLLAWPTFIATLPAGWLRVVRRAPRWGALLALLLLGWHGVALARRTQRFAEHTGKVALLSVADDYRRSFARYAERLAVAQPALLTVDVGGVLWVAKMRIYDLGTLCDRVITRALYHDTPRLHDYVFAETKPTFIRVHGAAAELARFDSDPRFRRDYVAIDERARGDSGVFDGSYVRRDALTSPDDVQQLRR